MQELVIVEYRPSWPQDFESERALLAAMFGTAAPNIEHIGSTAVPGLAAKPCVDILLSVAELATPADYLERATRAGYVPFDSGENDVRIVFHKSSPRLHNLHIVRSGSWAAIRPLLFRDYLRQHPDALAEYAALKRRLAGETRNMPTYTLNKTDFIERIIEQAARQAGLPYQPGNRDL
jgi:GrpB-like predicted nucleotidyltransferase (UPF0157 family)